MTAQGSYHRKLDRGPIPSRIEGPAVKARLVDAIDSTREAIIRVADETWASASDASRWDDWNLRDVVCHINAWTTFCCQRLRAIAAGATTVESVDVERFNLDTYRSHRSTLLSRALSESTRVLDALGDTVQHVSASLLIRSDQAIGTLAPLWRYVACDGFAHPTKHLLFHCLKGRRLSLFYSLQREASPRFRWYAPRDKRAPFRFREFFSTRDDCTIFFENLRPTINTEAQREIWEDILLASLREGSA
jgi:hypothetical protein